MRKYLLMALAGLALALAVPVKGSATPVLNGEALKLATQQASPVEAVQWRRRYYGRRYYRPYRRYYRPYRVYRPYRFYRPYRVYRPYRFYGPRRFYGRRYWR
jgi:hypothetical protein